MNDYEKAGSACSACYGCKQAYWDTDGCHCACMLNGAVVQEPRVGCPLHEFSLHSATKYDDGTPIMSEPEKVYCDTDSALIHGESNQYVARATLDPEFCEFGTCPYYDKFCDHTLQDKHMCRFLPHDTDANGESNQLDADFCKFGMCAYYDKFCDHTLQDKHKCRFLPHDTDASIKYLEQTFTEFAKIQNELIEEYDATLKTHGDTLEQHKERITINEGNIDTLCSDVEDLQRKVYAIYQFLNSTAPDFFFNLCEEIKKNVHKGSDFCGNCSHCNRDKQGDDTVYVCDLSHEIVDPDSSSCSMFEPPF